MNSSLTTLHINKPNHLVEGKIVANNLVLFHLIRISESNDISTS